MLRRRFRVADFHLERGAEAWSRLFRRYAVSEDGSLRYGEFALAIRSGELAAKHGIAEWSDLDVQDIWRIADPTGTLGGSVQIEVRPRPLLSRAPQTSHGDLSRTLKTPPNPGPGRIPLRRIDPCAGLFAGTESEPFPLARAVAGRRRRCAVVGAGRGCGADEAAPKVRLLTRTPPQQRAPPLLTPTRKHAATARPPSLAALTTSSSSSSSSSGPPPRALTHPPRAAAPSTRASKKSASARGSLSGRAPCPVPRTATPCSHSEAGLCH